MAALPVLIRRIAARIDPGLFVQVPQPVRVHRNKVGKGPQELEEGIKRALNFLQEPEGVLILLDADVECPVVFGPALLAQARAIRPDIPLALGLAKHEYENWFIAAAESLRGQRGLAANLSAAPNPEGIRDAKGWLRSHMPQHRKYAETKDQPALTARFDLDMAFSRSDSFNKCYREIELLLRSLIPSGGSGSGEAGSPSQAG